MKAPLKTGQFNLPKAIFRLPLLIPAFIALGLGVLAGLSRLGWNLGSLPTGLSQVHGPLMVAGFFGTVIGLERAVALRHSLAYLAPALSGLGTIAFLTGAPDILAGGAILAGSFVFLGASIAILRIHAAVHIALLAIGALALVVGNLLWLAGASMDTLIPWWIAFLVLTIVGERLELSRMRPVGSTARTAFLIILAVFGAATVGESYNLDYASHFFGLALAGLAAWLVLFDIARVTVRQRGLVRYIAVCLLSGYGWLAVGGLIWAWHCQRKPA